MESLSLADNALTSVPHQVLKQMPQIRTLNLGFGKIENITDEDFKV